MRTVRDAAFEVLRQQGLTTLFANPGSTEVPLLADLPEDIRFVLGLHESAVVGMATGQALATGRPALVNVHTVAGLANAAGGLATARQAGAPLVVLVGLQDRRHLDHDPFLSGPVAGLAGDFPVSVHQPPRPQDVPAAIARAAHLSTSPEPGPALVLVPMSDWDEPAAAEESLAASADVRRATTVSADCVEEVAQALLAARNPVLVAGAGADDAVSWAALERIADQLGTPVWQEALGHRAGFRQDHPRFAGHLPVARTGLRQVLEPHDLVLVVGAPVFRQYPYDTGPLVPDGSRVLQVTASARQASGSASHRSWVAPVPDFCRSLGETLAGRRPPAEPVGTPARPAVASYDRLTPETVFGELAARLSPETVIVEESPSSGPLLRRLLPARTPGSRYSAAGGGLGFAVPAAIGLKLAQPERPVVCVVGDGSSLYSVQSLWSAVHYEVGVLFVVLSNSRYAIMDRLADQHSPGAPPPWPSFEQISIHRVAGGLGCPSIVVDTPDDLAEVLGRTVPELPTRTSPLLLDVAVGS